MKGDEHTNQECFVEVGDGHRLYVHDWGNPKAAYAIIFLHGGPGNGCFDKDKTKFDPGKQRVIFYDQRGAGQSTPKGLLENNTTDDLVGDISKVADQLGLDKFVLAGGSWGTTLALAYGIAHPERVVGMVLDGIYTATPDEAEWFEKGGWREFFPDAWEEYQQTVPASHRDNPSRYHYEHALGPDPEAAKRSSYDYVGMEVAILKLDEQLNRTPYEDFEPGGGFIEMHYIANGCFLSDNYILNNAAKLTMPVHIVQGRYDMVCRPMAAHTLHKALPNSQLIWTINGHLKQHEARNIVDLLLNQLIGAF